MKTLWRHSRASVITGVLAVAVVVLMGTAGRTALPPNTASALGPGSFVIAAAAADMFLKIDGVDGESTNAGHKNWIEIQSWSWGVSQMGGGGGGGGLATGRLTGHVTLIKRIDKASPLLFKRGSDGTVLPLVTIELTRGGTQTYLKYELKEVLVSSIAHGDVDGDGAPDETITLDFTATKLTYTQLDASGKPVGQTSAEGASVPAIR